MKKTASSTVIASIAASSSPAYSFRRDLKLGMSGEDVRQLQLYLNKHSFSIAVSGPGSPGAETSYFGRATQAALIRFQKANGIMPAAGYFGPKTRAFIAGPATPTSSSGILLTSDIGPGYVGDEVTELQIFLNTHGFPVAQSGPGSSGNETQDFGPATHAALVRFQDAHAAEILAPLGLTKGSGYLGAATRAYINGL
jgi:peptidoglycan hydrolase-like protein with peptidoglycan-binding domain